MAKKGATIKNLDPTFKEGETRQRYRVQFDISYGGSKGKKMDPDSDTIPDLNLTIRQLIENHTRGKDNDVEVRKPLYLEFPIPNLQDITDVEEYKINVQHQLKKINQFITETKENETKMPTEQILEDSLPEKTPEKE